MTTTSIVTTKAIRAGLQRLNRHGLTTVAAMAIGTAASLSLGTASAHAAPVDVRPGVTCDDTLGVINCNNTTDVDYTIIEEKHCLGGSWTTTEIQSTYNSSTHMTDYTPKQVFHSADPSIEHATVFAAAHNNGLGYNGCDYEAGEISYSIAH